MVTYFKKSFVLGVSMLARSDGERYVEIGAVSDNFPNWANFIVASAATGFDMLHA